MHLPPACLQGGQTGGHAKQILTAPLGWLVREHVRILAVREDEHAKLLILVNHIPCSWTLNCNSGLLSRA